MMPSYKFDKNLSTGSIDTMHTRNNTKSTETYMMISFSSLRCDLGLNVDEGRTEWQRQSTLVISTSLISNNRFSRSEYLVPVLHENLTTGDIILWKRREIASTEQFLPLSNVSIFRSICTYSLVKCGCSIYVFLNFANLICRGTDILKYFRESLGFRDNESRLYVHSSR